jgi:hypothetical protein
MDVLIETELVLIQQVLKFYIVSNKVRITLILARKLSLLYKNPLIFTSKIDCKISSPCTINFSQFTHKVSIKK